MAIKHIASVPVYVSDNDTALDFYCNKLGFEKRADTVMDAEGHRWLEVYNAPVYSDQRLRWKEL